MIKVNRISNIYEEVRENTVKEIFKVIMAENFQKIMAICKKLMDLKTAFHSILNL